MSARTYIPEIGAACFVVVGLSLLLRFAIMPQVHASRAATAACMPYAEIGVTQSERAIVVCATPDGGIEAKEFTP